ncbi:SDR family oxidoreductase [Chitinasiproducens palmae]|uniref:Nucleoside-diphosphate-sugar epimerase n=1 Tax=Chitinasiproducens palmae TaxID=1770053 RepID=A0A1H2PV50_9BURK|nr:SDR family oxidoreductase [Chitinasiproducens palmae]SDV50761.1 Nucleoside-diphosphate-sugar epimerase [Chitinasiproducens palmae]
MRIFLTGATGFIGSRVLAELLGAGHEVLGLTRSDAGARKLEAAGAAVHRGTLEAPTSLQAGAEQADAVIHTAFDHDFSNFVANCEKDRRVIAALGEVLRGSDRPLLITSGTGMGTPHPGAVATEDVCNFAHPNPRVASEQAGVALLDAGVNVSVMRLAQIHDTTRQGLVTPYIASAREKGKVGYIGSGTNRWPAAHVLDAARLYRLAIERAERGARYHAAAETGIPSREIAETIGRRLGLPVASLTLEAAQAEFGWLAPFLALDMPASSALTRERLGWTPVHRGLIADLQELDLSDSE